MNNCTRVELDAFIKAYPRKLERNVAFMIEPPLVSFNDFSLGDWPKSIVASYVLAYRGDPEKGWQIASIQPQPRSGETERP